MHKTHYNHAYLCLKTSQNILLANHAHRQRPRRRPQLKPRICLVKIIKTTIDHTRPTIGDEFYFCALFSNRKYPHNLNFQRFQTQKQRRGCWPHSKDVPLGLIRHLSPFLAPFSLASLVPPFSSHIPANPIIFDFFLTAASSEMPMLSCSNNLRRGRLKVKPCGKPNCVAVADVSLRPPPRANRVADGRRLITVFTLKSRLFPVSSLSSHTLTLFPYSVQNGRRKKRWNSNESNVVQLVENEHRCNGAPLNGRQRQAKAKTRNALDVRVKSLPLYP